MVEITSSWYRLSAKAIIRNEKWDFLMCKEDNWMWDLPGGGLDRWEHPITCIKRELLEEMGLKVSEVSLTPSFFVTAEKPNSQKRPWIANICYETKVESLNFKSSEECVEIGFFNPKTIKNIKVFENITVLINEMEKNS